MSILFRQFSTRKMQPLDLLIEQLQRKKPILIEKSILFHIRPVYNYALGDYALEIDAPLKSIVALVESYIEKENYKPTKRFTVEEKIIVDISIGTKGKLNRYLEKWIPRKKKDSNRNETTMKYVIDNSTGIKSRLIEEDVPEDFLKKYILILDLIATYGNIHIKSETHEG